MSNLVNQFIEKFGQKYSEILGIDLKDGRDEEVFKWFLASILFGAPINETSATKTYMTFRKYDTLTPAKILETGWDGLVQILDEGGYTRYDFKTSDKLLEVMKNLTSKYNGSLNTLHNHASDPRDLEVRLKTLGKGIGDVTVTIFLRELRGIWKKADPVPTPLVILAARNLGYLTGKEEPEEALRMLMDIWRKNMVPGKDFTHFETALLRLGKDFCRRKRCKECQFKEHCQIINADQV